MMDEPKDSIGATVRKMIMDAKVVAALSPPELDPAAVRRAYERLWDSYSDAMRRIERLEIELAHWADLKWKN